MNLLDFDGGDSVKEQLEALEKSGRLPHAIMIDGATAEKRAKLCDLIAMWAVCSDSKDKPCGRCKGCINAKNHRHPDVTVVEDSTSVTSAVSVETIRSITSDSAVIPNEADAKVYIIYDADKRLSGIAQNAFLKTLEEPPKNVLFLLTCEDNSAMLQTVRSRSAQFSLENEDGYTEQQKAQAAQTALAVIANDEYPLLKNMYAYKDLGSIGVLLDMLALLFADGLSLSFGAKARFDGETASKLAKHLTREKFLALIDLTAKAKEKIKQNVNMNLLTTWLCAELRSVVWRK